MKRLVTIAIIAVLALSVILAGCGGANKVVIGSKDFTENIILAELMAQMIENHSDITVERKLNLGGTFVDFEAIKNGEIDMYPEYTGTGLTAQLKMGVINDPEQVYNIVKDEFNKQFDIAWLQPLGLNNTYAIAVTDEAAKEYGLEKTSDLAAVSQNLVFGAEHEFFNREDGYDGLVNEYGITFKDVAKMNVSLKYQAIGNGTMDVTDAFATDGQIIQYNLKILDDDKDFFPPYYAAPIVRNDTLKKYPELEGILNKLSGQISDQEMTEMNYKADIEKVEIPAVASEFLKSKSLID